MNILKYLPFILLAYYTIKLLTRFFEENIISLKEQLELSKIENGIISINDLDFPNYDKFIKVVNLYLNTHGYENIVSNKKVNSNLTIIHGFLNNEGVYINCIQNEKLSKENDDNWCWTSKEIVNCFIARMINSKCKKGLLITNSSFDADSIKFIDSFNDTNTEYKILLIDGYELTRNIRNSKNYWIKVGTNYEFK